MCRVCPSRERNGGRIRCTAPRRETDDTQSALKTDRWVLLTANLEAANHSSLACGFGFCVCVIAAGLEPLLVLPETLQRCH